MEMTPDLTAALAALRAVGVRFATASDDELLADLAGWEALGRLVDARRIAAAAEVEQRSPVRSGMTSLAFRRGARDGQTLVADVTRIDPMVAKRRIGLGAALAGRVSITGDLLQSRYPALTEAVTAGRVGVDAARLIVEAAQSIRRRVDEDRIQIMVEALTADAEALAFEIVRDNASWWMAYLDQDGPAPDERTRRRKRRFKLGRVKLDGTASFSGIALAEDVALLKELFASRRRGIDLDRTEPGGDTAGTSESIEADWVEKAPAGDSEPDGAGDADRGDARSREQFDYDALVDTVRGGMAAERAGTAATSPLHDIVVTITAEDLEARRGRGWTAGVMAGLSIPTVERLACTETVRLLVTGGQGEPLHLGRSTRCFTAAQKKALTVAAGGRCQVPGCTVPAPYLEAHHALWWERDAGPTDVDHGIMLCSYHHHLVHAKGSPLELLMWRGDIYIVPAGWRGPPVDEQRRQRGLATDPRINAARRRWDPSRNPFAA